MPWTKKDDDELLSCLTRLEKQRKIIREQQIPIETLINNTHQIQSTFITTHTAKHEPVVNVIKPKDKWGEDMKDVERLKIKKECVDKTTELLGDNNAT